MTQPEALRLADLLEQIDGQYWQVQDSAAAELRRLHAQRDALLEALKVVLDDLMYKDHARVIDVARAAIATVEGEKT